MSDTGRSGALCSSDTGAVTQSTRAAILWGRSGEGRGRTVGRQKSGTWPGFLPPPPHTPANAIREHGFPIYLKFARHRRAGCAASTSHLLRAAEAARAHEHEAARAEFTAARAAAGDDEACPPAALASAEGPDDGHLWSHAQRGHRGRVVASLTTTPA